MCSHSVRYLLVCNRHLMNVHVVTTSARHATRTKKNWLPASLHEVMQDVLVKDVTLAQRCDDGEHIPAGHAA